MENTDTLIIQHSIIIEELNKLVTDHESRLRRIERMASYLLGAGGAVSLIYHLVKGLS